MSLPLWVLPSPKTWTPSSRIARTIAVAVTARPSGVVLKYFFPPEERWKAPVWMAVMPSRARASRQSTSRAATAPCSVAMGGMSAHDFSSGWARSAVYACTRMPFSAIHATAQRVSRPPEKAMPMGVPCGGRLR